MNPALVNNLFYGFAMLFALLLHALVVVLVMFNWQSDTPDFIDYQPYYIEATTVAENPYTVEQKNKTDREQNRLEQRLKQHRLDEAKFLKDQAQWARDKEQEALRELEKQKKLTEQAQAPAPVKVASEPGQTLDRLVSREQDARKAVTDDEKTMAYVGQIQQEIIRNWSRPPSARNGMQATLRVFLVPTGEVVDVKVDESSGNDAFDRSAVLAVRKAEQFVVPGNALMFERSFREFTVVFRPEDLRL